MKRQPEKRLSTLAALTMVVSMSALILFAASCESNTPPTTAETSPADVVATGYAGDAGTAGEDNMDSNIADDGDSGNAKPDDGDSGNTTPNDGDNGTATPDDVSEAVNAADDEQIEAVWHELDGSKIRANEIIVSVSPSGKYVLTVDSGTMDASGRLITGKNAFGWVLDHMSLYTNQDDSYTFSGRIDIDAGSDPWLNDTLATCREDGVAWIGDEPCMLITAGLSDIQNYLAGADADIYFVDFRDQSVRNLTGFALEPIGVKSGGFLDLLPHWYGSEGVFFIRHKMDAMDDQNTKASLMRLDIDTGHEKAVADLSIGGGIAFIYDYDILGDSLYFSVRSSIPEKSGLYTVKIDKDGSSAPSLLLGYTDMREDYGYPGFRHFTSVQISPDGGLICLTTSDDAFYSRQPDRRSIVVLYDLNSNGLIDPFAQMLEQFGKQADPVAMITGMMQGANGRQADISADTADEYNYAFVTAAAFSPDGNNLLCAVWLDGFGANLLYLLRLDDGSYDDTLIYIVESGVLLEAMSWSENNAIKIWPLTSARGESFVWPSFIEFVQPG